MLKAIYLAYFSIAALILLIPNADAHSWYPLSCCSNQDCEAIPAEGVVETPDGFHVTYVSPRFGPIDEIVPRRAVQSSEDGNFHGCWKKSTMSPRHICFFAPLSV